MVRVPARSVSDPPCTSTVRAGTRHRLRFRTEVLGFWPAAATSKNALEIFKTLPTPCKRHGTRCNTASLLRFRRMLLSSVHIGHRYGPGKITSRTHALVSDAMSLRAARAPVGAPPPAPAGARNTLKDVLALSMGRVALDTEGHDESKSALKSAIAKRQSEMGLRTEHAAPKNHKVALMFSSPSHTATGATFPVEVFFLEQKPGGEVSAELSEIFVKDIIPQISEFLAVRARDDPAFVGNISGFVQGAQHELSTIVELLRDIPRFRSLGLNSAFHDVTSKVALRSDDKTRATLRRNPRFTVHVELHTVFDVELFGLMIADKIHDWIDLGRPAPAPDNDLANDEEKGPYPGMPPGGDHVRPYTLSDRESEAPIFPSFRT